MSIKSISKMPAALSQTYIINDAFEQPKTRLTFYDCFRSVHKIARLFGLLPFKIVFDSKGNVERTEVNVPSAILFAGSIIANAFLVYIIQYSSRSTTRFGSPIIYLADRMFCVISYVILFSSIVVDMVNRNRLLKLLKDIMLFDKVVRQRMSILFYR